MAFNFGAPSGTSGTAAATAAPAETHSCCLEVGLEDLGQHLQLQVLHSAFLPQLTQALLDSLVVLRTKVLDLVLVLAQQRELVLV
uniref:Nucleoporin 54 n=1 Tax=Homo sapiens TaxID=9606 RepID=A0A8Q3SI16_HUMAN